MTSTLEGVDCIGQKKSHPGLGKWLSHGLKPRWIVCGWFLCKYVTQGDWRQDVGALMRADEKCAIAGNSATPGYVNLPSTSWKLPRSKNLTGCLEG